MKGVQQWQRRPALVAAAFLLTATAAVAEDRIAIGPYVQNVTSESAVVCWGTRAGESWLNGPKGKRTVRGYEHHRRTFADLKPETRYEYDVLGDGSPEGRGHFTTFPEQARPFRFAAFGDTRSRHDVHARLVRRILSEGPVLVINTGDLVSNGLRVSDWETFFEISGELMRHIPYYPLLGNHEKDSPLYFDFFDLPGNERRYSFSVGDAFFLMLDSEGPEYETPEFIKKENLEEFWARQNRAYMEAQKHWADEMLYLHRDAGFTFVCFHKPLYSAMGNRLEDARLRREFWGDLFERHGVQVVLNGHDHHYHHAAHGGTHYIVTGGGGANLYAADAPQPETIKTVRTEHYIRIEVGTDEATLTAIDMDGRTIDVVTVAKRP